MKVIKKIIFAVFVILFFSRIITLDRFNNISGVLTNPDIVTTANIYDSKFLYILIYILRFLTYGCVGVIIVNNFFNYSYLKKATGFIVPIIYLINIILIKYNVISFIPADYYAYNLKFILFLLECLLGIVIAIFNILDLKKDNNLNIKELIKGFLYLLLFALFLNSASSLKILFGKGNITITMFNLGHLIIVLVFVSIAVISYFSLRNKDKEFIRMILFALSIGAVVRHFHYQHYAISFNPFSISGETIPLNLCHLGIIFMPICLITKNRKIALFTVINSVGGGVAAFLIPAAAFNLDIFEMKAIHFLISHSLLIILPSLMFKFELFDKVEKKDYKFLLLSDLIYWIVIFFANSLLPNVKGIYGVSYFSANPITASDFVGIIPNGKKLLDYVLSFSIGSFNINIYYVWWPCLIILLLLATLIGTITYKIVNHKKRAK